MGSEEVVEEKIMIDNTWRFDQLKEALLSLNTGREREGDCRDTELMSKYLSSGTCVCSIPSSISLLTLLKTLEFSCAGRHIIHGLASASSCSSPSFRSPPPKFLSTAAAQLTVPRYTAWACQ